MIPVEPFSRFPKCVKCGHEGAPWRYGTANSYRYGYHGELIDVVYFGETPEPEADPHVIVRCYGCHYQWLMRPADYQAARLEQGD